MTRPTSAIEPFGKYRLGIFYFFIFISLLFRMQRNSSYYFSSPENTSCGTIFRDATPITPNVCHCFKSTIHRAEWIWWCFWKDQTTSLYTRYRTKKKKKKKEKNTKQNATNILSSLHSLFFLLIIKLFCFSRLSLTFQTEFVTLKT